MPIVGRSNSTPVRRRWLGLVASGALGAALFFMGRLSAPHASPGTTSAEPEASDLPSQPNPHTKLGVRARSIPRLAAPGSPEACAATTDQDRKDTAAFVMDSLFGRIEMFSHSPMFATAEARANQLRPFVHGLADGIRKTRPDLFKALAEDFNDRLCKEEMSDDRTILLSYFAADLPEMVDTRGLDCFFSRAKGKEDVPLWSMLDAWRASGLEKTAALAQVQDTASDQRTIRRFMTPEDQQAARSAGANAEMAASGEKSAPLPTPLPSGQELSPAPAPSQN